MLNDKSQSLAEVAKLKALTSNPSTTIKYNTVQNKKISQSQKDKYYT
jgi:hypothetical protein